MHVSLHVFVKLHVDGAVLISISCLLVSRHYMFLCTVFLHCLSVKCIVTMACMVEASLHPGTIFGSTALSLKIL